MFVCFWVVYAIAILYIYIYNIYMRVYVCVGGVCVHTSINVISHYWMCACVIVYVLVSECVSLRTCRFCMASAF
jgi:hypothetical protein